MPEIHTDISTTFSISEHGLEERNDRGVKYVFHQPLEFIKRDNTGLIAGAVILLMLLTLFVTE